MVMLESCCLCRESSILDGISPQPGHLHANINWCCPRGECANSYFWFCISARQLRGAQLRHRANTHKMRQVFRNGTLWIHGCAGQLLNPWERPNSWSGNHCVMSMSIDTEGCFKSIQSWLNSGLFICCTGCPGWAKGQSMSWGQQEIQEQEIIYPCLLHQVFVHVILLKASVKKRNYVPSSVKESFRFRHWTESWALFWGHHCSAAHLERVGTLLDFQTVSPWVQSFISRGMERDPDRGLIFMTCKFRCGRVMWDKWTQVTCAYLQPTKTEREFQLHTNLIHWSLIRWVIFRPADIYTAVLNAEKYKQNRQIKLHIF